jgi:diguanylate cyclase (GGDEF)-like protein
MILAGAATAIKNSVRKSDFVIRWGGEEFLIIMSSTDMEAATAVLARLRRSGFGDRPDGKPQTASMGLVERVTDDVKDDGRMIELADQRLYQAKVTGRNRCVGSKVVFLR